MRRVTFRQLLSILHVSGKPWVKFRQLSVWQVDLQSTCVDFQSVNFRNLSVRTEELLSTFLYGRET